MVRIIAAILAVVLVIGIIGSVGFIGYKTGEKMINQHFAFGEALQWAWDDYKTFITGIFGKANAENNNYFEMEITVNKYVEVKGCTSL